MKKPSNLLMQGILNALCLYNMCRLIDEYYCPDKISFYYKAFTFPQDDIISITSSLKATFPNATNILDTSG